MELTLPYQHGASHFAHTTFLTPSIPPSRPTRFAHLRVVKLDWQRKRLRNEIPSLLSELTALTQLALSGNNLTGPVPSELGKVIPCVILTRKYHQLSNLLLLLRSPSAHRYAVTFPFWKFAERGNTPLPC